MPGFVLQGKDVEEIHRNFGLCERERSTINGLYSHLSFSSEIGTKIMNQNVSGNRTEIATSPVENSGDPPLRHLFHLWNEKIKARNSP